MIAAKHMFESLMRPWLTPSSEMNFLIQTASFAASEAAMYSTLVEESAIMSCLQLFQVIAPPFKENMYPD